MTQQQSALIQRLASHFKDQPLSLTPLHGGDINRTFKLQADSGVFCLKFNEHCPADFFHAEAHGLSQLQTHSPLQAPSVIIAEADFLVLEYINPAPRSKDYWRALAEGLAQQHTSTSGSFGLSRDNYCGLTPQPNRVMDNGYDFFCEMRLGYQTKIAYDAGRLSSAVKNKLDKLMNNIDAVIPAQPASLLHGDLWSGNIHSNSMGEPVLIDPAVYFGWRETDLTMTHLFGGFGEEFYEAYQEIYPMDDDWRSRLPLYNLYHLLNHLNLFGENYLPQVEQIVKRFT
ncbi:fructosamine kinase family protein [Aurantivibrio plasticivorans]